MYQLLHLQTVLDLEDERNPAVEAEVGVDDLTKYPRDAEVAADAIDSHISARAVLIVSVFIVHVHVDARPLRVTVAAAEREAILYRFLGSATDTSYKSTSSLVIRVSVKPDQQLGGSES